MVYRKVFQRFNMFKGFNNYMYLFSLQAFRFGVSDCSRTSLLTQL